MKTKLKSLAVLVVSTLLFTTSYIGVSAETDTGQPTQETQIEEQTLIESTSQTGFHMSIDIPDLMYYSNNIPELTLTVTGNNGSDTVTLTKEDLNEYTRSLRHDFNIGDFNVGDVLTFTLQSSDSSAYLLLPLENGEQLVLKDTLVYTVETTTYNDPEEELPIVSTIGKDTSLCLKLCTEVPSTMKLVLRDESGNILPNITVDVVTPAFTVQKQFTSNADGVIELDPTDYADALNVYSADDSYEVVQGKLDFAKINFPTAGMTYDVTLKSTQEEIISLPTSKVNLSCASSPLLFDISKLNLELNFVQDDKSITIGNLKNGQNDVTLNKGVYTITSNTSGISLSKEYSVTSGEGVDISYAFTHTLEVKNTDDEALRGEGFTLIGNSLDTIYPYNQVYYVLPNQSIMLKDEKSGKAYTVDIKEDSLNTVIDLSTGLSQYSGVVTQDKGSPKTSDFATILFTCMIIISLLIIGVLILRWKNKNKMKLLSILLLLSLMTQTTSGLFTLDVRAAGAGDPNKGGGSYPVPAGAFWFQQVDEHNHGWNSMLIKMSLIINSDAAGGLSITESSGEKQLADDAKFNFDYSALYIAPKPEGGQPGVFNRAYYGGLIGTDDDYIPYAKLGKDFSSTLDISTAAVTEWHNRLVDVEGLSNGNIVIDDNKSTGMFLRFVKEAYGGIDFYDDAGMPNAWGSAFNTYCTKNLTAYNEESTMDEAGVVEGYISYLLEYGLISENQAMNLREGYEDNKLTLLVENVLGAPINESGSIGYYFITAHDMTELMYAAFDGKLGGVYNSKPVYEARMFGSQYVQKRCYKSDTISGGRCTGKDSGSKVCKSNNDLCKKTRHIAFSGLQSLLGRGLNTIYPVALHSNYNAVKPGSNKGNPFGGWGFYELKHGEPRRQEDPALWATMEYALYDEQGNYVDTIEQQIDGFKKRDLDKNKLIDLNLNLDSKLIELPKDDTIMHNGKVYKVMDENTIITGNIYITDTSDNNNTLKAALSIGDGSLEDTLELLDFTLIKSTIIDDKEGVKQILKTYSTDAKDYALQEIVYDDTNTNVKTIYRKYFDSNMNEIHSDILSNDVKTAVVELDGIKLNWSMKDVWDAISITNEDEETKQLASKIINASLDDNSPNYILCKDIKNKVFTEVIDDNGVITYYYSIKNLNKYYDTALEQLSEYLGNEVEGSRYVNSDGDTVGNVKLVFSTMLGGAPTPTPTPGTTPGPGGGGGRRAEETPSPSPSPSIEEGVDKVPQWRINRYWNSIMRLFAEGTSKNSSLGYLTMREDSGCYASNSKLDPSTVNIRWLSPDLSGTAFHSNALSNLTEVTFNHDNPYVNVPMWGDLMAFKDNSVDDLRLIGWLKTGQSAVYEGYSLETSTGDDEKKIEAGAEEVRKDVKLSYSWEPTEGISHTWYARRHVRHKKHTHCRCSTNTGTEVATFHKGFANYSSNIGFDCYNHVVTSPSDFTSVVVEETNGIKKFTQFSPKSIKVYSEVPMWFTDNSNVHSNSIKYVIADRQTEIKPISFHSLIYDAKIDPKIVGTSVATDERASSKLNDLGMSNAQMINRGSGTNTSYDIEGTLTAKTYALDFQDDYMSTDETTGKINLKKSWGNDGYSAEVINDNFLAQFSTKDEAAIPTYSAVLDSIEKLNIGTQDYGEDNAEITATAKGVTKEEYKLTIRAGEIKAINGYMNWAEKYPELVEPLTEMKTNHEGVFKVFASGKGHILDEESFAKAAYDSRQNSDSIQVGKGWYSEDCTTLSLYVFTTVFELPDTVHTNKVPISIPGLESPQNKDEFYNKAWESHLKLRLSTKLTSDTADAKCLGWLDYNTANAQWANSGDVYKLYAVPNVSVQDTTR